MDDTRDDTKIEEFKDDFPLLLEAGFIAVKQLDETSAVRIFHAAQVIKPGSTAPQLGLGYISLNKLEVKEARKIFEEIVAKEPENYLARTFLGICFLLTKPKRKQGEEIIQQVLAEAVDPTVKSLAQLSLDWAEKDFKTSKASFFTEQAASDEGQ
jgi:hypothetical protein